MTDSNKIWQHNAVFWDQEALAQKPWSQPVSKDVITAAKEGGWPKLYMIY